MGFNFWCLKYISLRLIGLVVVDIFDVIIL